MAYPSRFPPSPVGAHLITGHVVDSRTGTRLTEAVVELAGLQKVVRVDSVGSFRLTNVPNGRVTLRTRQLGYYRGEGAIRIDGADSVRVEIALDPVLLCLDCSMEQKPTPGYVRIVR